MATQSKSTKAKTTTSSKVSPNGAVDTSSSPAERAKSVAEAAVDLPVGAVLEVTDRVTDLVEPFTGRETAEKKLKSCNRVEREARKRRRNVETTLKRNRTEAEKRVRKAIDEQTTRAQDLVDQVGEQLSALR
jgi:hypothetical protein